MSKTGPRIIFFSAYVVLLGGGIALNDLMGWGTIQQWIAGEALRPSPTLTVAQLPPSPASFVPSPSGRPNGTCLPRDVFSSAEVVAVGAYEGKGETDLAFEGEGDAVGLIWLAANRDGKPFVLLLNGYDPIIWDLSGIPAKRLRGIVVYGHGQQGVAHLPSAVPIRFAAAGLGEAACGDPDSVYKAGAALDSWQRLSQTKLGVGFDRFEGAYEPAAIHLDGGSMADLNTRPLSLSDIKASAPVVQRDLLAGQRGLRQLMDRGAIRPATAADWAAFGSKDRGDGGYVVLRAISLPGGMYGANSASFLVPRGVPMPVDPGSHNRIVREDGGCVGPLCGPD